MKNHFVAVCACGVFLIWSLVLPGCSSQTSSILSQQQGIFGNWRWIESVGGFAGSRITPESAGYTQRILIRPDSSFWRYRNDTLVELARFTIHREKTSFGMDSMDVIHFPTAGVHIDQAIRVIHTDTLSLVDLCMDCFGHTYVRIK